MPLRTTSNNLPVSSSASCLHPVPTSPRVTHTAEITQSTHQKIQGSSIPNSQHNTRYSPACPVPPETRHPEPTRHHRNGLPTPHPRPFSLPIPQNSAESRGPGSFCGDVTHVITLRITRLRGAEKIAGASTRKTDRTRSFTGESRSRTSCRGWRWGCRASCRRVGGRGGCAGGGERRRGLRLVRGGRGCWGSGR